jgi:hypothetical protein
MLMTVSPSEPEDRYVESLNPRQICVYRRMTGEQRLLLSLDMIRSTWRIAADAIRNEVPGITDAELSARIRDRRAAIYRHEAEVALWDRIQREVSLT